MRAVLALILLAACAPESDFAGPLVLSADAYHIGPVTAAAERWAHATGLELSVVDEGGVPVRFAPRVWHDGGEVCGYTELDDGSRVVALHVAAEPQVTCESVERTTLHELGHAISISWGGAADVDDLHTEDEGTLMASPGTGTYIDVDSLLLVCSFAPCTTFVNEQPPRRARVSTR